MLSTSSLKQVCREEFDVDEARDLLRGMYTDEELERYSDAEAVSLYERFLHAEAVAFVQAREVFYG